MATINTDIAQKIDIIARENNTSTINLTIASSTGVAFSLVGYNVSFFVYDNDSELLLGKTSLTSGGGIVNTSNGSNTLDSSGKITMSISDTDNSFSHGSYKYKLSIYKSGETRTWMYGKYKLNED